VSHYTDATARAETLRLGDRYKTTEHGAVYTVHGDEKTVNGGTMIEGPSYSHQHYFEPNARVYIVSRAPRCACRKPYDRCWNSCRWPQWADDLYSGRPAEVPAA
jgi:hypothetical protein